MKKIYLLIIAIILLFPTDTNAAAVNDITIIGKENIAIGEPFTESILITFDDIEKKYEQTLGILYLKYEIAFDSSFLVPTAIESPDWDTIIYQENEKYYVLSVVNTENRLQNNCLNSFLYCGEYNATIEFFLSKTDISESLISISNIEMALLDIKNNSDEYILEDIIIKNNEQNKIHHLTINQSETNLEINPKEDIITEITKEELTTKITQALNQEPIISTIASNLLTDIKITDYSIDFNKYKNNYTVTIPNEVRTLDLIIIPEDANATYEVIGNKNLTDNSQITIEVTSEDDQINIYTLTIKTTSSQAHNLEKSKSSLKMTLKDFYNKYKIYTKYGIIIIGILLVIIIITKIISKIKDQKIEDMTDKF